MAKKQIGISLRKPPSVDAPEVVTKERQETQCAAERARGEQTQELGQVYVTPSGRSLRELTLYLPQDLVQRLRVHCAERNEDTSHVVAGLIEKHLTTSDTSEARSAQPPSLRSRALELLRDAVSALLTRSSLVSPQSPS